MSSKYFITNLCTLSPDMNESDRAVFKDNGQNKTVSSFHNSIRSSKPCGCAYQQSACITTAPSRLDNENTSSRRVEIKNRSRSSTPKKNILKNSTHQKEFLPSVFHSTATFQNCQDIGDHAIHPRHLKDHPVLLTSSTGQILNINTGKSLRSCSCVSAPPYVPNSGTMRGFPTAADTWVNEQRTCASGVVSELRNDLEKVKSQLDQIVDRNGDTIGLKNHASAKQVYQLRAENKKLKKELEQKKILHQSSLKQMGKLKDILNEYDRKVTLLHQQAVKSSKVMKHTKEKFCKCLREKENSIKHLMHENEELQKRIQEKENQFFYQSSELENLQKEIKEKNEQNVVLSDTNQNFCECIRMLENQLENTSKENSIYKKLEQVVSEFKCSACGKVEIKMKKQKDKYENKIKEMEDHEKKLRKDIARLTQQVQNALVAQTSLEVLEKERSDLQSQLNEYEQYASRCKILEEDCDRQCNILKETEQKYNQDREQLRQLIDELTSVVKENKVTLLQLSDINKKQEELLLSQSQILLEKEEEIKNAGSQLEMLRKRSRQLEDEINEFKVSSNGTCIKGSCQSLKKQLEQLRVEFMKEKDNKLLKEKIIEDQSQTISQLQHQIKEKQNHLRKALENNSLAEQEVLKVSDDLIQKNMELDKELDEKNRLAQKLRKLEKQKSSLTSNLTHLEKLVEEYCTCQEYNECQRNAMDELQKKISTEKKEWECQKQYLAYEKEKAVKAAKFATQKLVDTVSDFQREVNAQKKVQVMLTKMLHDKEEELQHVKERISSINCLSNPADITMPIDEIFKHEPIISEPATTASYSSWSNSSKFSKNHSAKKFERDIEEVLEAINKIDEPVKDTH